MIIVEGCDGTGKTTLVQEMSKDLNLRVGPRSTDNRDELYRVTVRDTFLALGWAIEGYLLPYIWDRLFYSESIYSVVMGRPNQFSEDQSKFITRMIQALQAPVIVCQIPLDEAEENMEKAHQMTSVAPNFKYIYGAYTNLIDRLEGHVHVYNYKEFDAYHTLLEDVVHPYLKQRSSREWRS